MHLHVDVNMEQCQHEVEDVAIAFSLSVLHRLGMYIWLPQPVSLNSNHQPISPIEMELGFDPLQLMHSKPHDTAIILLY